MNEKTRDSLKKRVIKMYCEEEKAVFSIAKKLTGEFFTYQEALVFVDHIVQDSKVAYYILGAINEFAKEHLKEHLAKTKVK